jgi:hypothetical protein
LETICLKCLRKHPAQRYATANELADDLRRHLDSSPIVARRIGLVRRIASWPGRRPVFAIMAFVLLLSVVAGFGSVLSQWRRAEMMRQDAERRLAEAQAAQAGTGTQEELRASRIAAYSLLRQGDRAGYRQVCAQMLKRFGTSNDPWIAAEVALTCIQDPDAVSDPKQIVRLGEVAVAANPGVPWWQHALAGAYVRTGQYERALNTLNGADLLEGWNARVLNDLVRAVAYLRLWNHVEGRRYLDAALQWRAENHAETMPRYDHVSFEILRGEAEALLRTSAPPADGARGF